MLQVVLFEPFSIQKSHDIIIIKAHEGHVVFVSLRFWNRNHKPKEYVNCQHDKRDGQKSKKVNKAPDLGST